jgi:hypothetical protein
MESSCIEPANRRVIQIGFLCTDFLWGLLRLSRVKPVPRQADLDGSGCYTISAKGRSALELIPACSRASFLEESDKPKEHWEFRITSNPRHLVPQ